MVWNIFLFSIIYGIILPIDSYFSRWLKHVKTTNQVCMCPLYLHEISTLTDPGFRCRNAPGWWLQLHGLSQLPSALLLELRSGGPRFSAGLSEASEASEAWLVNEWLHIFCHIIRPLGDWESRIYSHVKWVKCAGGCLRSTHVDDGMSRKKPAVVHRETVW